MTRWYRAYSGTVTDPKLGEVALVAGCSRAVAIAAWHAILEDCAEVNDGGRFETTARRVAVILGEPIAVIDVVFAEMAAIGLIAGGCVASWARRQFESDGSAERVRRHRAAKRADEAAGDAAPTTQPAGNADVTGRNSDVTLHGRCVTAPEAETETESPAAGAGASAREGPDSDRAALEAQCRQALGGKAPPSGVGDFATLIGLDGCEAGDLLHACRDWAADPKQPPLRRWKTLVGWTRMSRDARLGSARRVERIGRGGGQRAPPGAAPTARQTVVTGLIAHAASRARP